MTTKDLKTLLTLDIGASSLKLAEFRYPSIGEMILDKFVYIEYPPYEVENSQEWFQSIGSAFDAALAQNNFTAKNIYISISGDTTFSRFISLPQTDRREEKIQQVVIFEAKQNIPYSIDEVTWDYQLIGAQSATQDMNVMFAVIKNDIITQIINIIEKRGFIVEIVDIALTASYNCARANHIGENESAMILNIGSHCSALIFIDHEKFYSRTIPVAGYSITQSIMKELEISYEKAEDLKKRVGFVSLGGIYEESDSELITTIAKIIRNVMTRLHGEIVRSINVYKSQQKGTVPEKLYLTGGSSVIDFTARFFSNKLRIPVDFLNPFKVVTISNSIDKEKLSDYAHMATEVIGLGLRHATTCPIEISLLPKVIKKRHVLKQRLPYFYAIAIVVILCLSVIYWGVHKQQKTIISFVKEVSQQIKMLEQKKLELTTAVQNFNYNKAKYDKLIGLLKDKDYWLKLLDVLQACLPDSTWIVELTPYTESNGTVISDGTKETKTLFGQIVPQENKAPEQKTNWIKIRANSLMLIPNPKITAADELKKRLLASQSDFFSKNPDEIIVTDYIPISEESNNIVTFELKIKLKKS